MRWIEQSRSDTDVVWIAVTDEGEPMGLARYDFADGRSRVVETDVAPFVEAEPAPAVRRWPWVLAGAVAGSGIATAVAALVT